MQSLDSSSPTAATEEFLDRFVDGDVSSVAPEEILAYATRAATEVFLAAQQVPIVVGYRQLPHLTPRQIEILELLNTGKTPKQVREQIFMPRKTMENHMSAIHKALETEVYWEAVKKARRIGMMPYPEDL